MASLTVRQLDDRLKRLLRLRAARHGRSMEDEVRTILAHAAQDADQEALEAVEPPVRAARQIEPARATEAKRVVLIIGGGIAAMHYIGMGAMRLPAMCVYSPALVVLSVVLSGRTAAPQPQFAEANETKTA